MMGLDDRHWDHISDAEAEEVLGSGTAVLRRHRRWLFAVARCRTADGDVYLKRQPRMGRALDQVARQHRLANHLAAAGVPAARALALHDRGDLLYEVHAPADGEDVYAGADSWDPFASDAHVAAAGAGLARLHLAAASLPDQEPQPQRGFVVQLDAAASDPVAAVEERAAARPAVAHYLSGRGWRDDVDAAYAWIFDRLRPHLPDLPRTPIHGDWQTNNLLFAGDRVAGIIDFHQADVAPRVLDLATAVERNCLFWNRISAGDDGAHDLRHAALLIGAYARVAPLAPAEAAAFADVLAACQFEYGISFLDYYWGVEADRAKADWAWTTFVLGHARWWASAAGRRVHAEVARIAAGALEQGPRLHE
jgi:Ser/Thr protein kinase RdoA (MazF antagonist)